MDKIWQKLEGTGFKVSTDTRKDVSGTVFFALNGDTFDGNQFVEKALEKGASAVVCENPILANNPKVFVVENSLKTLQELAKKHRESFPFPILAIGGSNGKTTTRELAKQVLKTKYKVFATEENLNNHIGLPLSIFVVPLDTQIAVFEIGANHPGEHMELLEILKPTDVLVTNNGLDHLEGFGSPEGVIKANNEIFEWAQIKGAYRFEKKNYDFKITSPLPLTISLEGEEYRTNLIGNYNLENIEWALNVGEKFGVDVSEALKAVTLYEPKLKRSQLIEKGGMHIVLDCYNANPTSMKLALESFTASTPSPRGAVLGDMLELGNYSEKEHLAIIDLLAQKNLDSLVLIGPEFKKALAEKNLKCQWFPDSLTAKEWFKKQNWHGYTLLLKGSRGIKVEKVIED